MIELITLTGGFWFLTFVGFIIVTGIVASEIDNFLLGTTTFIMALVGAQMLFDMPVWSSISSNPLYIMLFLVVFMIIGSAYTALWRWPEFLRDNANKINSEYAYCKNNKKQDITFDEYLNSSYYSFTAALHKDRLATWIITWPFSLLWELSRKPIKYSYRLVHNMLGDTFESIGANVARRIHEKNK